MIIISNNDDKKKKKNLHLKQVDNQLAKIVTAKKLESKPRIDKSDGDLNNLSCMAEIV